MTVDPIRCLSKGGRRFLLRLFAIGSDSCQVTKYCLKFLELDRLYQMPDKTCFLRTPLIQFGTIAGHGDKRNLRGTVLILEPLGNLTSVHARQAYIHQYDIGCPTSRFFKRFKPSMSDVYFVSTSL